jgi:predicted ATP-dependent endonuclease of OLD family
MKIRSIELTNFRKFVGTVRVDGIGDNVNVLVGRNELGKSTLLEAINGVIFEKAKSMAAHVKAFLMRTCKLPRSSAADSARILRC